MLFERHKKLAKQNFRYKEPDEVIQATNEYKSEANIFEQFNKEIINYAPGYYTTVQTHMSNLERLLVKMILKMLQVGKYSLHRLKNLLENRIKIKGLLIINL